MKLAPPSAFFSLRPIRRLCLLNRIIMVITKGDFGTSVNKWASIGVWYPAWWVRAPPKWTRPTTVLNVPNGPQRKRERRVGKIKQTCNISQSLEMRSVVRLPAERLRYLNGIYLHVLTDNQFIRFLKPVVVSHIVVGVLQKNGSGLAVVS